MTGLVVSDGVMLGIILGAVLATQASEPRPANAAREPFVCVGSLLPNTSTNGKDDHGDQISARMTLWADDSGKRSLLAYEYQTYGGREFIQFTTFSWTLFPFSRICVRCSAKCRRDYENVERQTSAGPPRVGARYTDCPRHLQVATQAYKAERRRG